MQIVINLSDKTYKDIKKENGIYGTDYGLSTSITGKVVGAIQSGTPLFEGCDIERITPKKVDVQKWIYTKCPNPNCNCELSTHHGDGYYTIDFKPNFCPNCGQALLWEESEV